MITLGVVIIFGIVAFIARLHGLEIGDFATIISCAFAVIGAAMTLVYMPISRQYKKSSEERIKNLDLLLSNKSCCGDYNKEGLIEERNNLLKRYYDDNFTRFWLFYWFLPKTFEENI